MPDPRPNRRRIAARSLAVLWGLLVVLALGVATPYPHGLPPGAGRFFDGGGGLFFVVLGLHYLAFALEDAHILPDLASLLSFGRER